MQRFRDGEWCEGSKGEKVRRTSSVFYKCAEDAGILRIETIVENPLCHYTVHAASSVLCSLRGFVPPRPRTVELECELSGG